MSRKELELIEELMAELQQSMELSEDDLSTRLGRKKPEVSVAKVSLEPESDEMADDLMDAELEHDELDEDERLLQRLKALKG